MSAANRVIAGLAGATVVVLAGVAGAISYSHMAELARLHGEVGWRSHAFPLSVDGIEIVASLVLLARRRSGTRAGWLPWAALAAGTVASVAANVAVGASDPVGRLVAGWPAVALLVAIKLLSGLLDAAPGPTVCGRGPSVVTAGPPPVLPPGPLDPNGPAGPGSPGLASAYAESAGTGSELVPDHRGTDPDGLVAAALVVRDRLVASDAPVNRRNLAAGLRQAGHRVRNDRLGHLLRVVTAADEVPEPLAVARNGVIRPDSTRPGGEADA